MNSPVQLERSEPLVVVPPRTRLYRLEPIGLGTAMVESLASFIHRLAEAHGVPTSVFLRHELAPRFQRKTILGSRGGCDLLGKMGSAINGDNGSALEAVQILATLTGHERVGCLNFSKFGGLLAGRKLLRSCQAWCPQCLEEWRRTEQPIYQPLQWLLADLKSCPQHKCWLEEGCPNCRKSHTPLGRYRWNGCCPRCSLWLAGYSAGVEHVDFKPLSGWDEFVAASIPGFLVSMQTLPRDHRLPVFPSNLAALIDQRFGGNSAAMAKVLGVTRKTVNDWADGLIRPSLASLLALEHSFGARAFDWITVPIAIPDLPATRPINAAKVDRIHPVGRRHHLAAVRSALVSIVESNAFPPRSLRAVCRELGFQQNMATRMFPRLARQIIERFRFFQTERKRMGEWFMKMLVRSALNQLLYEGRSLSFYELAKVLPPHISTCDKRVLIEFKRLQREAEDEMQAVLQESASPSS